MIQPSDKKKKVIATLNTAMMDGKFQDVNNLPPEVKDLIDGFLVSVSGEEEAEKSDSGQRTSDNSGSFAVGCRVVPKHNLVHVSFNSTVKWFSLEPMEAAALAKVILSTAIDAQRKRGGTSDDIMSIFEAE